MKQKNQIVILAVLVVLAAAVWYYEREDAVGTSTDAFVKQSYQLLSIENPQIQWGKLADSRKTEYKSNGRNPFSKIAAPTPIEVAAAAEQQKPKYLKKGPAVPPPPPPVQPPNLKFFGYGTVPNGTSRRAFFTDGEEVYIVAEGETLQGRFRIIKVNNNNLEFEELSSGRHSTMPLIEEPVTGGGPT